MAPVRRLLVSLDLSAESDALVDRLPALRIRGVEEVILTQVVGHAPVTASTTAIQPGASVGEELAQPKPCWRRSSRSDTPSLAGIRPSHRTGGIQQDGEPVLPRHFRAGVLEQDIGNRATSPDSQDDPVHPAAHGLSGQGMSDGSDPFSFPRPRGSCTPRTSRQRQRARFGWLRNSASPRR